MTAEWTEGTFTTGYWDCCKLSCAWPGKGNVDKPVRSCEAETGSFLSSFNVASVRSFFEKAYER